MGYYLLPAAIFYSSFFIPDVFGRTLPWLFFSLFLFFFSEKKGISTFILLAFISYLLAGNALRVSYVSFSIPDEEVEYISGRVLSEPSRRKNRDIGYKLELVYAVDGNGSVFTSKGAIYVISDFADCHRGDRVILHGALAEKGYFLADSTESDSRASFSSVRSKVLDWIYSSFRIEGGALAAMLLLGSDENGDSELTALARKGGLSHLLALSGMHLSIIATLLSGPFRRLFGKRISGTLVLSVLILFSYLSGWRPSLTRALLFRVLSAIYPAAHAFPLSMVFLLLLMPSSVLDLGAAFSFIALAGILSLSEKINAYSFYLLPVSHSVSSSISASLSALIFSVPLSFMTFGEYQLYAVLTGTIATLMITVYMYLSIASLLVFPIKHLLPIFYRYVLLYFHSVSLIDTQKDIRAYCIFTCLSLFSAILGYFLTKIRHIN